MEDRGQASYRCRQVLNWLYSQWATEFEEMTSLSAALREALAEAFIAFSAPVQELQIGADGTVKFLHRLVDGEAIESVFIPSGRRRTVCISTQVGCPVGCAFCASGRGGFTRNLDRAEIVDQVIHACQYTGERVTNVVVMGIGEPLLNLGELVPALDLVCRPDRLGLSARHVTVSTSGIPDGIRELAECGRPWNLALSLHATSDRERALLIPPPYRAPLDEILRACTFYRAQTHRMVTLEYAIIAGQNDSKASAERLAAIALELRAKVNLIPCNPIPHSPHAAPPEKGLQHFLDILLNRGVQATIRKRRGDKIRAACGQLRAAANRGAH